MEQGRNVSGLLTAWRKEPDLIGMAVIAALRFTAISWRVQLPTFHVP